MARRRRDGRAPLLPLVAEGFLSRLSFGLVSFALPLYAVQLGMSLAAIGFLLSFNLLVAVALKPFAGWIADRAGLRRTLGAAIVLRTVVTLLLVVATSPAALFAARGLHGVSIALRDPSVNALVAAAGGQRAIASAFAWYQTAKTVAGNVGRFAAGVALTATGSRYPVVFLLASLLSVLPLMIVGRISEPAMPSRRTVAPSPGRTGLTVSCVGLGFATAGTAYLMANLLPVLATEWAGLSAAAAGSVYLVGTLAALTGPLWGWVADHISHRFVLSVRSIGNIASSAVWLVWPTHAGIVVGKALDDVGKAAFRPAWGALMAKVAGLDPRRRARTMGYLSMGEDAGELAGPIVAGLIWSTFGIPALLVTRVIAGIGAEIATHRVSCRLDMATPTIGEPPWPDPLRPPRSLTAPRPLSPPLPPPQRPFPYKQTVDA